MGEQEDSSLPPHVLIFPLPVQGHVNSMLHLAKLLCLTGDVHVTFFVSDFVHRHASSSFHHPSLRFRTISDGLPADHPRNGGRFMEIIAAIKNVTAPMFRDMMVNSDFLRSGDRRPVTCIMADGLLSFVADFALERGIPLLYFRTGSASALWACFCCQEVIDAGELPIKGNGMDLLVKSVPGMEGVLRRRDLPSFCRVDDISDHPVFQFINTETRQTPRAQAVILNTFEALEASVLCHVRGPMPNLFTIGPLHSLLNTKTANMTAASSGSFLEEDRSCLKWLDAQPAKSVIYVSFGSLAVVTREQLVEFWHGLVNSGQRFLWVMRPGSVSGQDGGSQVPAELAEG
ncbi:hypothetical protein Acr_03g0003590 [Actinidia rufa]|uniref:Uncharacterized protein n=1 Tax=Actinidia rufa TaxID=165716 RepID=A0A7J0EB10_9ERIC|nr:hypothetical protein Acr_03g0003590 [Actinidia rufa]